MMTTMELNESDSVCQASAISAMEPLTIPAHIFRANNNTLPNTDTVPS